MYTYGELGIKILSKTSKTSKSFIQVNMLKFQITMYDIYCYFSDLSFKVLFKNCAYIVIIYSLTLS